MKIEDVPVDKINETNRHRQDMGDLETLAQSIRELGLLQPIGINKYYELVFGSRRLYACRHILEWTEIPAHILDFDSILLGEFSENEFRKEFTKTERIAIAAAVERELGNRQGQRTDKELLGNCPQVDAGRTTREIAAKRAGFKSDREYRRTATVVKLGASELVDAMDKNEISVSAAETIARTTPKDKQAEIVRMPKQQQRQAVKEAQAKLEAQREQDGKTEAYVVRQRIEDLGKASTPPELLWHYAGIYGWPQFPDSLEAALRYLIRLKEGHPNAYKKLERISPAN